MEIWIYLCYVTIRQGRPTTKLPPSILNVFFKRDYQVILYTLFTLDLSPLVLGFGGKRDLDDEALDAGGNEIVWLQSRRIIYVLLI